MIVSKTKISKIFRPEERVVRMMMKTSSRSKGWRTNRTGSSETPASMSRRLQSMEEAN